MNRRDALAGLLATLLGCTRKKAGESSSGSSTPAVASNAGTPETFKCPRCGKDHKFGEPGFNWPDAVFALSLPDDEKSALRAGNNEDVAVVRGSHFVRGVLFVPVNGWPGPLGIGLWMRLSPKDFQDFEQRKRLDHPVYSGAIANQATFLGPTLGLRATLTFRGPGLRPSIKLVEGALPLAQAQANGIADDLARSWLADSVHDGEPEPTGPAKTPRLEKDGYRLITATESGRTPARLPRRPASGDYVKIIVEFLASDEAGNAKPTVAGWWLELDEVGTSETWSGTLDNPPRVPAPVSRGSRFWVRAEHVIEFKEA